MDELRRAVQYRPGHLAERRVPRLDVVVVWLNAVEVRTTVLPQPVPQVHGVVAAPVEPPCAPDQLQLVEVRPINPIFVHVDQMWKTTRQVERHLRQYSQLIRREASIFTVCVKKFYNYLHGKSSARQTKLCYHNHHHYHYPLETYQLPIHYTVSPKKGQTVFWP